MDNYKEMSRMWERTVHKYMQLEKKPREYAPGVILTQSEIHTIAIIGDRPGINVTELAKLRGVTKGASSQMVYKLVDKGYITKTVSPRSDTEVCLTLTEYGKIPYEQHKLYHETTDNEYMKILSDMPEDTAKYFMKLLSEFEKYTDQKLNK